MCMICLLVKSQSIPICECKFVIIKLHGNDHVLILLLPVYELKISVCRVYNKITTAVKPTSLRYRIKS